MLQCGATTASYDREHEVNATYPTQHITRQLIDEVLPRFVGDIDQVPPSYSACKIEGERAYKMRRNGEEVNLKPKHIHIDEIEVLDYNDKAKQLTIRVVCGKGTYIRALARDIGRAVQSGAYLLSLRRTRVGDYKVENCIDFDHFDEWVTEVFDKQNNKE